MEFNKQTVKALLGVVCGGIAFAAALLHLDVVAGAAGWLLGILSPLLLGCAIAFILNVPMRAMERCLFPHAKKANKLRRPLALLLTVAAVSAVLALAGSSDGGGNKASPVSGTVDMTRMTADEVKTAIGAALDAGITEFKLTGEFAKIGIPARVSFSSTPPVGNPFYDSGVEKIDLTGVTDWPEVNVNGRVDDDFNFPPDDVRGLPARAFDGQKYDNGAFHYAYPALREVRLPAGVKALGCLAFFACQALSFVSCDGVEEVGVQALSGCPSLESVQLPEAVRIYNAAFMASGLTSLSLPETTRLGYSAFQHCDALTELRLTAAGNITLEMDSGATPFSPNFAKVCDLTLNADKHYSTGTAAPKAASADQWATNYYGDPLTWKSIAFE